MLHLVDKHLGIKFIHLIRYKKARLFHDHGQILRSETVCGLVVCYTREQVCALKLSMPQQVFIIIDDSTSSLIMIIVDFHLNLL